MFQTRRLKAELAALREEVAVFKQIRDRLDAAAIHMRLDGNGCFVSVNSNFETTLNYRNAELVGQPLEAFVPKSVVHTDFHGRIRTAIQRREYFGGAMRLIRKDGGEAWLRVMLVPVQSASGEFLNFTVYANDLTRTIEASRHADDFIKALMRSTAVIEFDLEGHVLTANDPFLHAMGYRLEQIRGRHHRQFCTQEMAGSPEYEQLWERLRRGEYVADRFKRVDSHGREVWLEASYNPISDATGRFYKVVKIATVITEQVLRETAIADAATMAYRTSVQTDNSAQEGAQVVKEAVSVMADLAVHMQDAAEGIEALDQQSQVISTIIKTISSIAEQTNLLALNAAIEAARAGEQGRGFAVVADEVRQLASRTSQATVEIGNVVQQNQALASRAVSTIGTGKAQAESGLTLANRAGTVISEIQNGAKRVVSAVEIFTNQVQAE